MRYRDTCIFVNLEAIKNNLRKIRSFLPSSVKLLSVVKANAYGHGAVKVSRAVLEAGADMLGVAIPEEGAELRKAGIKAPILVLGGANEKGALADAEYDLIQTVFDEKGIESLEKAACQAKKQVQAHLKIDSGMGRIGVRSEEEIKKILQKLSLCPHVTLTGVFTHFSNADGEDDTYSVHQQKQFDYLCGFLPDGLLKHAAASAALLKYDSARYDMVRAGLVMYGYPPCKKMPFKVEPAMSWTAEVTYVKWIEKGDAVSYGCTFTAEKPTRVATLAVGYGDGYHRILGNKGQVLLHGKRCPILGRVCMDQLMVDVTHVPQTQEGDEAVLMGKQGNEEITAEEMAAWGDTISYEMLLAHTGRVPVEYIEETRD